MWGTELGYGEQRSGWRGSGSAQRGGRRRESEREERQGRRRRRGERRRREGVAWYSITPIVLCCLWYVATVGSMVLCYALRRKATELGGEIKAFAVRFVPRVVWSRFDLGRMRHPCTAMASGVQAV
eukprot:2490-Rhodomonas_salina.1